MAREALWKALSGAEAAVRRTDRGFNQAAREYLEYVEVDRRRKKSTVDDYRSVIEVHLLPAFGRRPLERITHEDVTAFKDRMLASHDLSPRTINKVLTIAHGLFGWAERRYDLAGNPVAGVERQPVVYSGELLVLRPNELEAVAEAAEPKELGDLLLIAGYTGMRLGELRAQRLCDLDFESATIHVRAGFTHGHATTPKNHRVRSLPMIRQAATAYERALSRGRNLSEDALVFPSPRTGGYMSDSYPRRGFYDALHAAGLASLRAPDHKPRPFRFHDLRHTFGSLAVQVFPITDVKHFMGHASVTTTERYIHFVPKHDAAERLSRAFDGQALGQVGRGFGRKVLASERG